MICSLTERSKEIAAVAAIDGANIAFGEEILLVKSSGLQVA